MRLAIDPFRLLLISLAGWLNQQQQDVIDYLEEENHVPPRTTRRQAATLQPLNRPILLNHTRSRSRYSLSVRFSSAEGGASVKVYWRGQGNRPCARALTRLTLSTSPAVGRLRRW